MSLSELRTSPDATITKCGFIVKNSLFKIDQGGICAIKDTLIDKKNEVYQLESTSGGGDFFYPYRPKVGYCSVPIGVSHNGSIVLTGGMNGCSLEVYKNGRNFDFYHDTNGENLASYNPAGTRVCFVPYKSYAGPLLVGEKKAAELTNSKQKVYFQHTLITVRLNSKWQVFISGVLSFYDSKSGKVTSYQKFVPTVSNLITSFDDV